MRSTLTRQKLARLTQKRKKRVVILIDTELLFALQTEYKRRSPQPDDRVLINPGPWGKKPMTRPRLYYRMVALGKRVWRARRAPTQI